MDGGGGTYGGDILTDSIRPMPHWPSRISSSNFSVPSNSAKQPGSSWNPLTNIVNRERLAEGAKEAEEGVRVA